MIPVISLQNQESEYSVKQCHVASGVNFTPRNVLVGCARFVKGVNQYRTGVVSLDLG